MTLHEIDTLPESAWLAALCALPGLGPARLRGLLVTHGDGRSAWAALVGNGPIALDRVGSDTITQWRTVARRYDVADRWSALQQLGIRVLRPGDDEWPRRLQDDPDPPVILFATGVALDTAPTVAIVGTRRGSAYGRRIAWEFGAGLASAGVRVVSGLALGVDGSAHEGVFTQRHGAPPIGVVASGVDVVYPKRHRSLWGRVGTEGTLVAEAAPGTTPEPWRFPARNRIIAALADAVVVVESHENGGSLITVDEALERGVLVGAVPGAIDSASAKGTNRLIADGATPILDVEAILQLIGHTPGSSPSADVVNSPETDQPALGATSEQVIEAIGWSPVLLEHVCLRVDLDPSTVALAIEGLVATGRCVRSGGWIERVAS